MFVNCFKVTIPSSISEIAMKELSKEFGENIPKSLPFEDGFLYFTTHIFCVDSNVNIEEICNKYNYEMGKSYKIEIEDYMYNNNYTLHISYKKEGTEFYLELE
jgi:hypothetical protein